MKVWSFLLVVVLFCTVDVNVANGDDSEWRNTALSSEGFNQLVKNLAFCTGYIWYQKAYLTTNPTYDNFQECVTLPLEADVAIWFGDNCAERNFPSQVFSDEKWVTQFAEDCVSTIQNQNKKSVASSDAKKVIKALYICRGEDLARQDSSTYSNSPHMGSQLVMEWGTTYTGMVRCMERRLDATLEPLFRKHCDQTTVPGVDPLDTFEKCQENLRSA